MVAQIPRRRVAVVVAAIGLLMGGSLPAADDRIAAVENGLLPAAVPVDELGRTSSLERRMAEENIPGLSVAVIDGGRIAWSRAYGVVESGSDEKVTPQTLFLAGSVSKPVAATAALVLVQEGVLNLDGNVNDTLRSWKVPPADAAAGAIVTLRRLLTHTAGLTVHGFPGYGQGKEVPTVQEVLSGTGPANTQAVEIFLEPGSTWRYSGGGYTVMQLMVEEQAKRPFAEFLADAVLEPFGMRSSTFVNPLPESLHAVAAHAHWANGRPAASTWHTYPEMAAAGLWTTASDLARWAIGIQQALSGASQAVLSQQTAREMLTPHLNDWGLGPSLQGEGELLRFSHGGRDMGFDAQLTAYARTGQGAVLLINTNNNSGFLGEVLGSIARAYAWPGFETEQRGYVDVGADRRDALAGTYVVDDRRLRVRHSDGKLYGFMQGAPRLELLAESDDVFFLRNGPGTIEMVTDPDGRVSRFTWKRGDEAEVWRREPEER